MRFLFLLFVIVPIVEMWVLIKVGGIIGAGPTILAVMATAVIGIALLRQQGVSTLFKARQRLQQGQVPATELIEALFLAVGGALLLTPGFITDAFGFCCLIGPIRRLMIHAGMHHFRGLAGSRVGGQHFYSDTFVDDNGANSRKEPGSGTRDPNSHTIEGEYRREE